MNSARRQNSLLIALYVNAAILAGILLVLLGRSGGQTPAFAQQAPIAGGAGIFVVPAQFSVNTWGAYLVDVDTQTLCAYQFYPGDKMLRLIAARDFRFDRRLGNFNTTPAPLEVQRLVEKEKEAARGSIAPPATTPTQP